MEEQMVELTMEERGDGRLKLYVKMEVDVWLRRGKGRVRNVFRELQIVSSDYLALSLWALALG